MSNRRKILVVDRLAQSARVILEAQKNLEITYFDGDKIPEDKLHECHGLICRSRQKLNPETLKALTHLQVIVTATSGFDHIDLNACSQRGITVMHSPDSPVNTVTQLTWSLILACVHKMPQALHQVKSGLWLKEHLESFELESKVLGIVGLGRIGQKVAEIGRAFGCELLAYDPYLENSEFRFCERVSFEEILKRSDIISFHVPLTKETKNMLNRSQFEFARRGLILVNASRGSVIHELDLCEALENGWIGACGLDVFEKEPLQRNSQLLKFPNVVMTPHIGARSMEAFSRSSEDSAQKIIKFFKDGGTSDTLPPKAAWYLHNY